MISGDVPPRLDRKRKPGQSAVIETHPEARLRENLPSGVVVPNAVLEVIARALESKPGDRYRNATEFREAIEKLPTYTPTYIEPRRKTPGRRRSKVALWLVAIALGGAALLAFTDPGAGDTGSRSRRVRTFRGTES